MPILTLILQPVCVACFCRNRAPAHSQETRHEPTLKCTRCLSEAESEGLSPTVTFLQNFSQTYVSDQFPSEIRDGLDSR